MAKNRNRQTTQTVTQETTVSEDTTLDTQQLDENIGESTEEQLDQNVAAPETAEQPAEVAAPAPVAAPDPVPAPAVAVAPATTTDDLDGLDPLAKSSLQMIDDYIVSMRPGRPMDNANINRQQIALHRSLLNIINNVERDFDKVWAKVLSRFALHGTNGAFRETHVFRGLQNLTLGPESRQCFQRLINMCLVTAEAQSRHLTVKQIDFKRTLEFDITDAGRTKLLNFYRV